MNFQVICDGVSSMVCGLFLSLIPTNCPKTGLLAVDVCQLIASTATSQATGLGCVVGTGGSIGICVSF